MTRTHSSPPRGEPGGLFVKGERVPLEGVAIDVRATGSAARVTVSQRYRNAESVPVEAVYTFPLSESAAVAGFEAEIDGRRIVGRIEEREEAFEKYDDAMARGAGAFLLDQDRPDIFTASVGNLLPGQEVAVRLTYLSELEASGDAIRICIPTTVSPRYIPPRLLRDGDPADIDHLTPPAILGGVPYGLRLTVELDASADVREVSCPSHPARISLDGRHARIELAGDDVQLDRDFVAEVRLADPHEPSALVAREEDGTKIAQLHFFPDLSGLKRAPSDFVFLIDRSGSMNGSSIEQAKKALLLCLRSMDEGDRFEIIGFGSQHETMFGRAVEYTEKTLSDAVRRTNAIEADLGGTELLPALTAALEGTKENGRPRFVVVLTDGQVSNTDEVIDLAQSHSQVARIFTFGIGHGPSEHLVKSLARASGGRAELIHPNDRIEPRILRQFARMASASLGELRIDWGEIVADLVAPAEVPPLYDGDALTVYARITGGGPGEVAIVAKGPEGELRFPVTIDTERALRDDVVPALFARTAIRDLEEGRGETSRGSAQRSRRRESAKKKILVLAKRYGVLSSETSFVAIEEREADVDSPRAELRRIPIALTKGWGGVERLGGLAYFAAPASAAAPAGFVVENLFDTLADNASLADTRTGAPPPMAPPPSSAPSRERSLLGRGADALFRGATRSRSGEKNRKMKDRETEFGVDAGPSADELHRLVATQRADGSFELGDTIAELAGIPRNTLEKRSGELSGNRATASRLVATLVALEILESRFGERRDEWRLIADKARRFLAKHDDTAPAGSGGLERWAMSWR